METKTLHKYINENNFKEAVNYLEGILKSDLEEDIDLAYFYLSHIYADYRNKARDIRKAKKYAMLNINSKNPDPRCYALISKIEEDKNISMNFLKKGVSIFPKSISIYKQFLEISKGFDKLKYVSEIKEKNIFDVDLFVLCIQALIENEKWEDIRFFADYIINNSDYTEFYRNIFSLLKSISLAKTLNLDEAENIIKTIVEIDIENEFDYIAHIILMWVCSLKNDNNKVCELIETILPENFKDIFTPHIFINFQKILNDIVKETLNTLKDKKELVLKLKCFPIFYKYASSEEEKYTISDLTLITKYEKIYSNQKARTILLHIQSYLNKFLDCYLTLVKMYENSDFDDKQFYFSSYVFDDVDNSTLIEISTKLYKYIESNYIDEAFIKKIYDPIINKLWEQKEYKVIAKLCKNIDLKLLFLSNNQFELAYCCNNKNEFSDEEKSKMLYENYLLKEPKSTAALNNLGVIYKEQGDLLKAKEMFEQGLSIDKEDEYLKRNYASVKDLTMQFEKGLDNIKKEQFYIIEKLFSIIKASENQIIEMSYNDRMTILNCGPDKAKELMKKFQDRFYLIQQESEQYQKNKYKINPLVYEYVLADMEKIELNKKYEDNALKINIESFENIGYSKIYEYLNKINNPKLRTIVLRDIEECAYSYILNFNKTTIIMCGSIIEAVLTDLLENKGIKKYQFGSKLTTKNLEDMDLIDLLEVCSQEKLIKDTTYHLSQVLRKYRNIIHPSNEIKNSHDINSDNATLLWNAMKTVVCEIL